MSFAIKENILLADKNWFQTGGSARYYCEPTTVRDLKDALAFAQEKKLQIHVLGDGANTLIADEGFDGLIIKPAFKEIMIEPQNHSVIVHAGSGVIVGDLIEYCFDHGVIGLEEFSGIPGSVGGSVYNNLHYYDFAFSDFVIGGQVFDCERNKVETVDKDWFAFGYDFSKLHEKKHIVISVSFALKKATELEVAYARGRRAEIIRHRIKRFPAKFTCGSFFRNFHDDEVSLVINGKKMIWVAYYLDQLGLKGTARVGDAMVSSQHSNMIINLGKATSSDIIAVAHAMQEAVWKKYGVLPQPECELVGFKENPLKKI